MKTDYTIISLTQEDYDNVFKNYPDSKTLVVEADRIVDLPDKIRQSDAVLGKTHQLLVNMKTNPDYQPSMDDMEAILEITGMFSCEGFEIKYGYAQSANVKGARLEVIYQES